MPDGSTAFQKWIWDTAVAITKVYTASIMEKGGTDEGIEDLRRNDPVREEEGRASGQIGEQP